MAEDKTKDAPEAKKSSSKKEAPSPQGYVVAPGKAIIIGGQVREGGASLTAEEVADLEALVKGGYAVKA